MEDEEFKQLLKEIMDSTTDWSTRNLMILCYERGRADYAADYENPDD